MSAKTYAKQSAQIRTPTAENVCDPHARPSLISFGGQEKTILQYMFSHPSERFSIRGYAKHFNLAPSTIKDTLFRLVRKGFVTKQYHRIYNISEVGIKALQASDWVCGSVRRGVRDGVRESMNLSQHYTKYVMPLSEISHFDINLIPKLNPLKYNPNKLSNMTIHNLHFSDATLVITPKKLIIRVHDLVAEDTEEVLFQSFTIALKYAEMAEKVGLFGDTIHLEDSHFARMDSYFADFLSKIDEKYSINLGNGKRFWIDRSPPNRIEDETDDNLFRDRMDTLLIDFLHSTSIMSDVDKMKEVVGTLIKLKVMETVPEKISDAKIEKPSYFG